MPVDRQLWRFSIEANDVPRWPCPGCGIPALETVRDSFLTVPDRKTRNVSDQQYYPTIGTGRFVCLLVCRKCGESCAVSGNYDTSQDAGENGTYEFECGRPKSITPPPPMIVIPMACPARVKSEVIAAFSLYWNDLAASLNRIRNALELVLDGLKIPKLSLNKAKKKRYRVSLHQRIERLEKKRPNLKDICERMMAVKHLGNAGSHPGVIVKADDVFDGFDILERVLQDMYSKHPDELARAVKQINRRRGPRKSKT